MPLHPLSSHRLFVLNNSNIYSYSCLQGIKLIVHTQFTIFGRVAYQKINEKEIWSHFIIFGMDV